MSVIKKLALVAALSLSTTSCMGPNKAFNGLNDWNAQVTENRWLNEGIFLGLNIIPVYSFALLGDLIVLNSIEWWSGDNPMD